MFSIFITPVLLLCSLGSGDALNTTNVKQKEWTFASKPTWVEEFNYKGLPDKNKWGYDLGGSGWGNNEKQNYTNKIENASVGGGLLTIAAKKESSENMAYSSARMITKNKLDVLYGRIEVVQTKFPSSLNATKLVC